MDLDNFIYYYLLRGFKIMGINAKKIERIKLQREFVSQFQEFKRTLNLRPVEEYFELGVEAGAFQILGNPMFPEGKVLGKNDDLFWGFNSKGYQYTLRRQKL